MSLQSRLAALITTIKTETKALRTFISGTNTGDTSGLNTTATNLVGAINENRTAGAAAQSTADTAVTAAAAAQTTADAAVAAAGATINDVTASTTQVYSSSKTEERITAEATAVSNAAVAAALEGEDLSDLAAAVAANAAADVNLVAQSAFDTLSATVALKADASSVYTQAELGDPETDLVALWTAA